MDDGHHCSREKNGRQSLLVLSHTSHKTVNNRQYLHRTVPWSEIGGFLYSRNSKTYCRINERLDHQWTSDDSLVLFFENHFWWSCDGWESPPRSKIQGASNNFYYCLVHESNDFLQDLSSGGSVSYQYLVDLLSTWCSEKKMNTAEQIIPSNNKCWCTSKVQNTNFVPPAASSQLHFLIPFSFLLSIVLFL